MATLKTLNVSVKADTKNYNKGMKKAARTTKILGMAAKAAKGGMLALAGGMAIAAAGMTVLIKKSLEAGDRLAKLSAVTGVSVSDFEALGLAARLAGASTQDIEKGISIMQKKLGEASLSTGIMSDAINDLGLNLGEIKKLGAADAFIAISEAIEKLPTVADQAAFKTLFFSRGALTLGRLMQGAREQINAAREDIKRFGGALSDVEQRDIENANDAIERMSTAIDITSKKFTAQFAPAITFVAKEMQKFIPTFKDGLKSFISFAKFVIPIVGTIRDAVVLFAGGITFLAGIVLAGASGLLSLASALLNVQKILTFGASSFFLNSVQKQIDKLSESVKKAGIDIAKVGVELVLDPLKESSTTVLLNKIKELEDSLKTKSPKDPKGKLPPGLSTPEDVQAQKIEAKFMQKIESELKTFESGIKRFVSTVTNSLKSPEDLFREYGDSLLMAQQFGELTADAAASALDAKRKQLKLFTDEELAFKNEQRRFSRGQEISDMFKSPMDAFTEGMEELKILFSDEAISKDVFDAAAKSLKERFESTIEKAVDPEQRKIGQFSEFNFSRVNTAVLARSAETVQMDQLGELRKINRNLEDQGPSLALAG